MAITRVKLTGSTNGRGIKVTGTTTGATVTVHTADASALDQITLWAVNSDTVPVLLTIEMGGATDPDDLAPSMIPAKGNGPTLVVPGLVLTGSLVCKAFAATASKIVLFGTADRIT